MSEVPLKIEVLRIVDIIFYGRNGDSEFICSFSEDITKILAHIRMGIKGNREKEAQPLSLGLIWEAVRKSSEEGRFLGNSLINVIHAFEGAEAAKAIHSMLGTAQEEVNHRFYYNVLRRCV